jgi:hypothetical protein
LTEVFQGRQKFLFDHADSPFLKMEKRYFLGIYFIHFFNSESSSFDQHIYTRVITINFKGAPKESE